MTTYQLVQNPSQNMWTGRNGHKPLFVFIHGTAGPNSIAWLTNPASEVSAHYVITVDGVVHQLVQEADTAWSNGAYSTGFKPYFQQYYAANINPNYLSISIEHEKLDTENADTITTAQQASSFALVKDICTRNGIPMRSADASGGICAHADIDPVNKSRCPGVYPWSDLWTYLTPKETAVTFNTNGKEVGDFIDADQFQPAKTQGACGFFSVGIVKAMAPVGHSPAQTVPEVINEAEAWYALYNGTNDISSYVGMDQALLNTVLNQQGFKYINIDPHAVNIQAWLSQGYPVILCADEASIIDMALNGNPYTAWTPTGSHIFTVTGIRTDGNFIVRDTANCTSLTDPNSLRPGPRSYLTSMSKEWATAVVPAWLPVPQSDYDPTKGLQPMTVPANWKDDGTTLTAPNGFKVIGSFRQYVLTHPWDSANLPLENEVQMNPLELSNTGLGKGTRQLFRTISLELTPTRTVFAGWIGTELQAWQKAYVALMDEKNGLVGAGQTDKTTIENDAKQISDLGTQVAELEAKLATGATGITPEMQAAINSVVNALTPYVKE